MSLLAGKKALILGVANDRSIGWGIAQFLKRNGASIALSYMNEAIEKRVAPLAEEIGADFTFELDVAQDSHIEQLPKMVEKKLGKIRYIGSFVGLCRKRRFKRAIHGNFS